MSKLKGGNLILTKYTFRNMIEKKGRFILLLISIALSSLLVVVSLGISDMILDSFSKTSTESLEGRDMQIISSGDDNFFEKGDVSSENLSSILYEIDGNGIYFKDKDKTQINYVNIKGRNVDDISSGYDKYLLEGSLDDLGISDLVISKRISEEKDIKLDDIIEIYVGDGVLELSVSAIVGNESLFYGDLSSNFSLIVSDDTMQDYFDLDEEYNTVIAKIDVDDKEKFVEDFNDKFHGEYTGDYTANVAASDMNTSLMYTLYIMLGLVVTVSFIIIYSTFKLIVNERLSEFGTFMSVGATRGKIKGLIYVESILYGTLGGIIGIVIGGFILYILNRILSPLAEYGIYEPFQINYLYLLIAFLFPVILSFISSAIPARTIERYPVKDVILNTIFVSSKKDNNLRFIAGLILVVLAVIGAVSNSDWTKEYSVYIFVASIIGIILIYPKIVRIFTKFILVLFKNKSAQIYLALKNVNTSNVLIANIALIIIAMLGATLVNSAATSIIDLNEAGYRDLNFSYYTTGIVENMGNESNTNLMIKDLEDIDGVENGTLNPLYQIEGAIDGKDMIIEAVKPEPYANFVKYLEFSDGINEEVYTEFKNSNEDIILISEAVADEYKMKKGQIVELEINEITNDYEIIGIFDGKLYNNGFFIISNYDDIEENFKLKEASLVTFMINKESKKLDDKINEIVIKYGAVSMTKEETLQTTIESGDMIFLTLNIFSLITIVIASLGIFNNIAIAFSQRKREFALYGTLGMNRGGRNLLIFTEATIIVLWGVILTLPYSYVVAKVITKFIRYIGMPLEISIDLKFLITGIVVTLISVWIATIPVIKRDNKLTMLEVLRYE